MINACVVFFKLPEQQILNWNIDDIIRNNFIIKHYIESTKQNGGQ